MLCGQLSYFKDCCGALIYSNLMFSDLRDIGERIPENNISLNYIINNHFIPINQLSTINNRLKYPNDHAFNSVIAIINQEQYNRLYDGKPMSKWLTDNGFILVNQFVNCKTSNTCYVYILTLDYTLPPDEDDLYDEDFEED